MKATKAVKARNDIKDIIDFYFRFILKKYFFKIVIVSRTVREKCYFFKKKVNKNIFFSFHKDIAVRL